MFQLLKKNGEFKTLVGYVRIHLLFYVFSLLLRFTDDTFDPEQSATIGMRFFILGLQLSQLTLIAQYDWFFTSS